MSSHRLRFKKSSGKSSVRGNTSEQYATEYVTRGREEGRQRTREREGNSSLSQGRQHRSSRRMGSRSRSRSPSQNSTSPRRPRQTYILIYVNDRLGTKTQIPCLPSDTIGHFKKLVSARIGRQPHEIMLKRQGERPFKDTLTLDDYGISNGVQLDLELDTGD